jgi:hypothetical protein
MNSSYCLISYFLRSFGATLPPLSPSLAMEKTKRLSSWLAQLTPSCNVHPRTSAKARRRCLSYPASHCTRDSSRSCPHEDQVVPGRALRWRSSHPLELDERNAPTSQERTVVEPRARDGSEAKPRFAHRQ